MKNGILIACWIGVVAMGAFLRLDQLSARPMHADEATGARITAWRMESGNYKFDPRHFHGPLLSALAVPLCKLHGETRWQEMTKATLRTLPALAGICLVLVPLLGRRRWGDAPMLLAAALLATSPLLVYYSRMFIHEPLLVLFGALAILSLVSKQRYGITGILVGLMFSTKESFVISILAWTASGVILAVENRGKLNRSRLVSAWRQYRMPAAISILTATAAACWFYTDGFRQPQGAGNALKTFFIYATGEGHNKGFGYYIHLLAWPKQSAGVWWCEAPPLLLALSAYLATFRRDTSADKFRPVIRFLSYSAACHFLIYNLIAYKTPWLICLPWAHVLLLAGFGIAGFSNWRTPAKLAFTSFVIMSLASQFMQARQATGRLASDSRNPYAYVPTCEDMEKLEPWIRQFASTSPDTMLEPMAVIGGGYWPLPWYLRFCGKTGYWQNPPEGIERLPIVFAMPEALDAVTEKLAGTHTPLPRGLRAEVPIYLFIRNDIWNRRTKSPMPASSPPG